MSDLISRQAAIDAVNQIEWLTEDAKEILEDVLTLLPYARSERLTECENCIFSLFKQFRQEE